MKEIQLTKGKVALVDDEDFERLNRYKWYAGDTSRGIFYARRTDNLTKSTIKMHRFILGVSDSKTEVDFINGDTLDNRKINLRLCSREQNSRNRRAQKNNTSGYKGVCFNQQAQKYQASIQHKRRHTHIGLYETVIEAALAYNKKAIEVFGEFASLNNVMGGATITN